MNCGHCVYCGHKRNRQGNGVSKGSNYITNVNKLMQIFKIKVHFSKASTYSARQTLFPKVTWLAWQSVRDVALMDRRFLLRSLWKLSPKIHGGRNTSKETVLCPKYFNPCKGTIFPDKNCTSSSALALKKRIYTRKSSYTRGQTPRKALNVCIKCGGIFKRGRSLLSHL